jgi:hypothetical protein
MSKMTTSQATKKRRKKKKMKKRTSLQWLVPCHLVDID